MRPYTRTYDQVVASFASGTVMTPRPILDRSSDYAPITETGTVPGAGNSYSVFLKFGILKQTVFSVTDTTTSEPLDIVPFEQTPGPGEAAVLFDLGLIKLHSSRTGHALSVPYTPLGSVIGADFLNWLQAELVATQAAVAGGANPRVVHIDGVPDSTTAIIGRFELPQGSGVRTVQRLTAFAKDITGLSESDSDETTLRLTTAATNTGGVTISLPCIGTDLQKQWSTATVSLAIDVSGGAVPVNVFCSDIAGGHGNITLEATIQ